jgi:hypothetical protein
VEVFESLPSTDRAILSALTNLEADKVDVQRLESALSSIRAPVQEFFRFEGILAQRYEGREGSSRRLEEKATQEYRSLVADLQVSTLEYVVALLRHYRPEFDDLPREEKHGLIVGCCKRVNILLDASRQLGRFLEYGTPNKDLRPPVEKAQEYVRAAELKDVEGLSDRKIGEMLGIDPAPSDSVRRQNSRVNHAVKQGRRLLFGAWGEDGWQKRARAKSGEREWFFALTEDERRWVRFAEEEGWGAEEGLRLAAEEEAKEEAQTEQE